MKHLLACAFLTLSMTSYASYDQAPPSFSYKNSVAVYVDFTEATYDMVYDLTQKTVRVESTIHFTMPKAGLPIFDTSADVTEIMVDGKVLPGAMINDPDMMSAVRIVNQVLEAGEHVLKTKSTVVTNVVFSEDGVASGLWMSDLNDRRYLEQYLPANLEYDQYKMRFNVTIVGAEGKPHLLKTNGTVTDLGENRFEVLTPDFYTGSSVFFHLYPAKNPFNNVQFYYPSIDGRQIPVDIYTIYDVNQFVELTKTVLAELETDYGAFPHDKIVIYGSALSGGMEHSGATSTALSALGHELFHSYHARGLMPANGNAGWMDEAIARWRDNKYPTSETLPYTWNRLAGHSPYLRMTNRMAYTEGSAFLAYVAFKMNANGLSMKGFLRDYFDDYKYQTVTTELFEQEMSKASGMDLSADFNQYIYGRGPRPQLFSKADEEEDPMHPRFTAEQLLKMTWPQ